MEGGVWREGQSERQTDKEKTSLGSSVCPAYREVLSLWECLSRSFQVLKSQSPPELLLGFLSGGVCHHKFVSKFATSLQPKLLQIAVWDRARLSCLLWLHRSNMIISFLEEPAFVSVKFRSTEVTVRGTDV